MDFNHLHFYVKDLAALKDYFLHQWGAAAQAWEQDQAPAQILVRLGQVPVLISAPAHGHDSASRFLARQAEGVGDVAFRVSQLDRVVQQVLAGGGHLLQPIQRGPADRFRWCQIQGWGSLSHTLIEAEPGETWLPGLSAPLPRPATPPKTGIEAIDHVVLNLPVGDLQRVASWYQRQLGFQPRQEFVIDTPRSGLRSLVLGHPQGKAQIPINEPTTANSQVQEFLNWNRGAGIQHVALRTTDIVATVARRRRSGVRFLQVPPSYYDNLERRLNAPLQQPHWQALRQQQILMDWEPGLPSASLLQTFSQPIFGIPTLFFELIQRQTVTVNGQDRLAEGFGEGNFRALFEAMEREQIKRGSLDDDAIAKNCSPTTG